MGCSALEVRREEKGLGKPLARRIALRQRLLRARADMRGVQRDPKGDGAQRQYAVLGLALLGQPVYDTSTFGRVPAGADRSASKRGRREENELTCRRS